eukprot:2289757-Pleurochrysis_carterae.AAC.1
MSSQSFGAQNFFRLKATLHHALSPASAFPSARVAETEVGKACVIRAHLERGLAVRVVLFAQLVVCENLHRQEGRSTGLTESGL